ncbi:MAG: hypothetical protein ACREAB_00235 [Blastocatellia bacterium]
MNEQNTEPKNNQSVIIEDLDAQNAEEIKGGPTPKSSRTLLLKTTVPAATDSDED